MLAKFSHYFLHMQTMREIDEFMTAVLVIWFLIITAVVGLNLFIALLSDTFQRVYDNAQANALLEQVCSWCGLCVHVSMAYAYMHPILGGTLGV